MPVKNSFIFHFCLVISVFVLAYRGRLVLLCHGISISLIPHFYHMRLRLNLSLRRALMAAMTVAATLVSPAYGGVVDSRYDLQYYMDFCRNKGMFAAGATNIEVYYKDGTHIDNNVIPLMPNMDSYGQTVTEIISIPGTASQIASNGGTNLVSAQFLYGAKHVQLKVGNTSVAFLSENAAPTCVYSSANLDTFGTDSAMQRLTKLVTAVAYTPLADDAFMSTLKLNETWLYRTGNGGTWCEGKAIGTAGNALGGVVNLSTCWQDSNTGEWYLEGFARTADTSSDTRTPLDVGVYFGDSGSPFFAWDDANNRFVFVGALFASNAITTFPSWYIPRYNYQQASAVMDKYFVSASFSGTDTIVWSASDAVSGKGTLTQNDVTVEYTGKGSGNTLADSLGLMFSSESSETQVLQLQGNVNMGAGALTFESGRWRLTEQENADYSLTGAGFEIKKGAEVTWELTGSSSQEIRKVGEGVLTISGSGNNESSLVVGGGSTVYNVVRDDAGNIIGCTLGNAGETRLNRENGYAASSVRLEGGVAIIVLMADNQFKTNSVQGDTFSFGNDGGLLNLNGHDLTWGVINQDGSGTGARIGNFTPEGMETTPSTATFTYTGTGTFAGCFMDEGPDKAQLKVAYNHASGGQWTLTGQHSNAGGFVVQAGTMALQGSLTPHVNMSDGHDWTYATLESSGGVTIENGATFRLSHHALMSADVTVNQGATFLVNHTANAVSESISGSGRMDMRGDSGYGLLTSFKGNVALSGSMVVDTGSSPVMTSMQGNITGTGTLTKRGSGNYFVDGAVNISSGTVEAGGLIIRCNLEQFGGSWTIKEQGYLGVEGVNGADLLRFVSTDSSGVLALGADQTEALDLSSHQNLYIGALGTLNYGSADKELAANGNKQWLLGGGGGTLNVLFRLTGENDLIIGNDYSGGTVHLSNIDNDFTGDIYIKGTGNILTYATDTETGNTALGTARVALSYGNTLGLNDPSQLSVLREGAHGVLALTKDMSLDLTGKPLSVGAAGALTLTSELTVGDVYRFGGQGDLTIDTNLASATAMELDGQGNSGSSVTFARNDAFSGVITAGGGLHLEDANSSGDIGIHVSNEYALAAAEAIELQKGATLYTDGGNLVVHNLSATTGSAIKNNGTTASMLQLNIDEGVSATIENGVLSNTYFVNDAGDDVLANLHIVKTGKGTVSMGGNTSWSGGLTIMEGQVNASIANGGIGAAGSAIYVTDGASLQLTSKQFGAYNYRELASTVLPQKLSGDGEVSISNGNDMLFMTQAAGFEGTIKVTGNTRLYITKSALIQLNEVYSTSQAFDNATIVVESGSQARLTPSIYCLSGTAVQSWADYVISGGADFLGNSSGLVQSQHNGALVVDGLATVWGNVTLADDAMIASWSHNPSESQNYAGSYAYRCLTTGNYANRYGIINKLGGIIRGQILGEVEEDGTMTDLTIGGTEGITITADSANTFEDLIIANGNSKNYNSDLIFALRLDGGEAISKTSTALGTGTVSLNDGLILRLAGTGASNSDIVYTYENAINAGDGATLQSYYITNRLTGTVTMQGDELNLATANGGVLELVGGISGSGTLNVAAGSKVILGSAAAGYALARTGGAAFSGTVATAAGSDITLTSPAVVANDTVFTGTDSLTLRLGGAEDFTFGRISLTGSQVTGDEVTTTTSTTLNLYFDFTNVPDASDQGTWNTLNVAEGITADSVTIALDLNMFGDIKKGSYTLISEAEENTAYSLADTMNNRLSLSTESGTVVLTVGDDDRLYWRTDGVSEVWNTTDANWYSDATSASGYTPFAANADVMLDSSGVAEGNGPDARETISLSDTLTVGTMSVKDAAYEVTGTGAIHASSLTVGEGGDLKLSNSGGNTFTNGVLVNAASLSMSSAGALVADVSVENNASFSLAGGSMTGQMTVTDASAAISDASLTGNIKAQGTGHLALSAATFSNAGSTITFDYGSLSMTAGTKLGGTYAWVKQQPTVQVENMAIADGSLTATVALQVDSLDVASGSTLVLNQSTGMQTSIGKITGSGSLTKKGSDSLFLGSAALTSAQLLGGVTHVTGSTTVNGLLSVGKATLNIDNGASVSVSRFVAGNEANGNSSVVNVNGGTLTITGSTTGDSNNSSFLLAHWKSLTSQLTLNSGEIVAENATMHMGWDSGGTFTAMGGTATLKGVQFSISRNNTADTFKLGTATEGTATLVLGASGIVGIGSNDVVQFGEGTVRANAASVSISGQTGAAVQLIGTVGGTIFDTDGHSITVNTAINGQGSLTKSGAGTLILTGDGENYSGHISVQEGALAVNAASKNVLTSASSVSFADNTVLDLSAIDFSAADSAIDVSYGTSISLSDSSVVAFANMQKDTEYGIFNITGGELLGWGDFDADNFTIDGVSLSDMGRVSVSLGLAGTFSYSIDSWDLVWAGGENGTWNQTDATWQTTRYSAETGEDETFSTAFVNNDNVTFNSTASLQVADGVIVNNVAIGNHSTVTLDGSALKADKVTIEAGSKLKGAYASVLVPVKTFDIAAGATLEMYVPGSPTYTAEVTGDGAVTMTGGGTLTWNAADGSLSIAELNITGGGTFKTSSAYTGTTVNITNGSAQFEGNVAIGTMNVAANKTATLWNAGAASGSNKIISTLHLADGAKLQTNDRDAVTAATTIGTLNLTGSSATLQDVNHSGWIAVHNIMGGADSTLNLVKNAMSNYVGIFTLGDAEGTTESGSAFAGTISVKQAAVTDNGSRDVALLLNHATVAQAATIDLNSATTSADANGRGAYVGLGVNVASATIGGLKSGQALGERAILFSGSQASNAAWADKSTSTDRNTLTISPASGTTHEYYGQVQNVNLVVDGAGTQKFLGTTNAGSIGVKNGTLMLGCAASADTVDVSGGAMKVNFTSANGATITDNANGSFTVGTLNYTGGTLEMSGTVNITTLKIGGGLTATVYNNGATAGQNKTFGTVELADGATLVTYDSAQPTVATKLGTVKLTGTTATIRDKWNSGYTVIENLIGEADDTLHLVKYAKSTAVGVFSLGGSNTTEAGSAFAGTIALKQTQETGQRDVALILNHTKIAQNATVDLHSIQSGATSKLGLGVNVAAVTIGGLKSGSAVGDKAILFSGSQASNAAWADKSTSTVRNTLTINTASGATHEYYGQVQNVNLVIDGEGTQKFLGTSNSFSGTVTVQGGTAVFDAAGSSLLEHATALSLTDGVLDLSAISFGTDSTQAISLASGATFSFDGGVIDLGNLEANTTYQIFDLSAANTTLNGWNLDTLSLGNFRINGSLMADSDGFVDISLGENGTFFYTMTNPEDNPLYWNGGVSSDWNMTDANWDTTPDVEDDALVAFDNKSAVVFADSATVNISDVVEAYSVIITDGAEVKLTMGANGGFTAGEVVVDSGTLELGSEKNWQNISSLSVGEEGVLRLMYGVGMNNTQDATDIFLFGGKIELRNGAGANQVLHADMVVDGSGTIAGSRNGEGTVISGTISGNGTLTFEADSGHNNWVTVSSIVSDGEDGTLALHVKDAQIKLTNAANSYTGATTIDANGKLVLDANATYTLGGTVSGAGTLEVAEGTTLANNSKKIDAALVLNGGNASITGSSTLSGDVTIKNGSTLTVGTSNGSDHFDYNDGHTVIVEEGGTLALGSNRETFGTWVLDVQGGLVTGTGATGDVGTAALDYHQSKTISASVGNGEIAAAVGVRRGNKVTFDVASGASLAISSAIVGQGHIAKATGTGDLIFTADNTYTGTTTISAGTLELQGSGQVGKGDVSIAAGGAALTAATTATVDEDGNVTAESEEWARMSSASDTAAAAVSGATIIQTEDTKTLAVASRSTDGTRGTMANTLVQIAADATLTVDSMIISSGSQISGTAARYAARAAESSLAQVQLSNSIVQLDASNSTVADAPVTMDFGTLQATGSSDASGALTLGAASKVLTVSTDVFSNLALTSGTNFVVDFSSLLSRVDVSDADFVYLSFADTVSADWSTTTLTGMWNDYQMDAYYHTAVAAGAAVPNVGVYFDVRAIPEPTSTTLSLLALAALAARRRRK